METVSGTPEPDFDGDLQQYRDRLIRFLLSLASERSLAEDIAQETILRAWGEATPLDRPWPWLCRVARNLFISHLRRENRIHYGSSALEGEEHAVSGRSVTDGLERAEYFRIALDEVLRLPEPYRSALIGYYLDGHPLSSLARHAGISPATMGRRIRRAVEMMRRQLGGRLGPGWRQQCLLLFGFGKPLGWVPRVLALSSLVAGVGVLVLGLHLLSTRDVPALVPASVAVSGTAPSSPSPLLDRSSASSSAAAFAVTGSRRSFPSPASPAPPDTAFFGFRGEVVFEDGSPASGVLVRAIGGRGEETVVTAGDGHFALPWPATEPWGDQGLLLATLGGFASTALGNPPTSDPPEAQLVLVQGAPVHFKILDQHGQLVPGAPISLHLSRTSADLYSYGISGAHGGIDFAVPRSGIYTISLENYVPGLLASEFENYYLDPSAPLAERTYSIVRLPAVFRLRAVDGDSGQPIPGARIYQNQPRSLVSDGRSSLVSSGGVYSGPIESRLPELILIGEAPGYWTGSRRYGAQDGDEVEIPLLPLVPLEFRVLDHGLPVADALLRISLPSERWDLAGKPLGAGPWLEEFTARTDTQGNAVLALPPVGFHAQFHLLVDSPTGVQRDGGRLDRDLLPSSSVSVELHPAQTDLRVRLLRPDSQALSNTFVRAFVPLGESVMDPLVNARASLELPDLGSAASLTGFAGLTDAVGELRASIAMGGKVAVTAQSPQGSFQLAAPSPGADGSLFVEAVLPLGDGSVSGKVLDASGAPDEQGFDLTLLPLSPSRGVDRAEFHTSSDSEGRFSFQGIAAAQDYRLVVSRHRSQLHSMVVRPDGQSLSLRLPVFAGVELLPLRRLDGAVASDVRAELWVDGERVFIGRWDGFRIPVDGVPDQGVDGLLVVGPLLEAKVLTASDLHTSPLEVLMDPGRPVARSFAGQAFALADVASVRRADLPADDLRQHLVHWDPVSGLASVEGAPLGRFSLQALDRFGSPLGSPLVIPAQ